MGRGTQAAFPQQYPTVLSAADEGSEIEYGLTVREEFASRMLAGMLANPARDDFGQGRAPEVTVDEAIYYADALIERLSKP